MPKKSSPSLTALKKILAEDYIVGFYGEEEIKSVHPTSKTIYGVNGSNIIDYIGFLVGDEMTEEEIKNDINANVTIYKRCIFANVV